MGRVGNRRGRVRLTYVDGARPSAGGGRVTAMWTLVGRNRALCRSLGLVCLLLTVAAPARAQSFVQKLQLRLSAAGALMMSKDQRGYLDYRRPGLLSDLQLEYHANNWFGVQLGAAGGAFLSGGEAGGLLAPMLGIIGKLTLPSCIPYLAIDVGTGFTGHLARPFGRARLGLDLPLGPGWRLGPALGFDLVTQTDGPDFSTDAVYAWVGVSLAYRLLPSPPVRVAGVRPARPPVIREREPIYEEHPPAAPSHELVQLLDQAVHLERSELLAPVLFEFDSVELEPSGLAMLHQVARLLNSERKDIRRLQILAYADARGSEEYNRKLASRRAEHVLEWLVAHGVARERLEASGQGAVDFVEQGSSEPEQQQNRRVVFRILRAEHP
jgi:outer membrane protein OmpA-like peptidoglycan-associated protein